MWLHSKVRAIESEGRNEDVARKRIVDGFMVRRKGVTRVKKRMKREFRVAQGQEIRSMVK